MLPTGADVEVGGVGYRLDQAYERITGRRCYIHGGRSIFAGRTDITGRPGAQNLKEDVLAWALTRFDGEGQVVLDPSDPASAFRFYRSEGLNFRIPGQAKLNKSTISQQMITDNAATAQQGAADFTDITGTSTTSGTDRKLVATGDKVGSSSNTSYASARTIRVDFYLYRDPLSNYGTTIQGSAFTTLAGSPETSGTDSVLSNGEAVQTVKLSSGTDFTAGVAQRVEFTITNSVAQSLVGIQIVDVTNSASGALRASSVVTAASTSATTYALTWTPVASHDYRFRVMMAQSSTGTTTLDKVVYGPEYTENVATIELWNATSAASVVTKTLAIWPTAAGTNVGSISYAVPGTDNYTARISRDSGKQAIWVDKVVFNDDNGATGTWVLDCIDTGLGTQSSGVFTPLIWLGAHASGVDSRGFTYNTTTDVWDSTATLDTATGTALTVRAMAHSDAAQYFLLSSNEIVSCAADGTDTLRATNIPNAVGMCVAQGRVWALSDGTDVIIYSIPLEASAVNVTSDATVRRATVLTGTKTPDLALRQRMCGTTTGARYFVNFGDVTAKVYETDGSGTTLVTRELADLGTGVKATSIAYEAGITFVGAQYYGNASSSDSDAKPQSVLFAIDQNGVVQRIGFFRKDDPDVRAPQFLVPYQTDLYILQGNYVWRYSLVTGGLFLEYQHQPTTAGNAKALAVLFGKTFAVYNDEVFVTGSVGTYRQSSVSGGNTFTSSIYDFGLPAIKKALTRIDVTTDDLASSTQVSIEYQIDQDGTWTLAGVHTSGSTHSFYIQDTNFTTIQVRATLSSLDGTNTPVLRGMTVWASSADDQEYFDLVLLSEDEDSSFRIAGEQSTGESKADNIVDLWRRKAVTTFRDGYSSKVSGQTDDYLVTIEDLRVEQNALGEGRTVVTLRVVR